MMEVQMLPSIGYIIILALTSVSEAEVRGSQTYTTCYQNITTDRDETGFIQIIALAINRTQLAVQANNNSFVRFQTVELAGLGASNPYVYNFTTALDAVLNRPDPVDVDSSQVSEYGIVVTSDYPIHLYSVKSDLGTTDGYLSLPLTNNSMEFMIVGWERRLGWPFLAQVMAVAAVDGTCVELHKIHPGGIYERVASETLMKYELFRYFAEFHRYIGDNGTFLKNESMGEDLTGYYLNSSKPVECIFGHECAWIPNGDNLFCDYIADTMIPINQLGLIHVVPMIAGRSAAAGYIVRVVPSQNNTKITYLDGQTITKGLGEYHQIDQPRTDQATVVVCDKPCAVYQYNKGYHQYKDVPTDPYMVMVTPNDRFTAGAPFATASFCQQKNRLIDFDNYVTIITYSAYKDKIRFDDEPISAYMNNIGAISWTPVNAGGEAMVVTTFHIPHGYHYVSMAPGEFGSFAAYAHGHSIDTSSSSAYGFSCNFNSTGTPLSNTTFIDVKKEYGVKDPSLNATCLSEEWLLGSIVKSSVRRYVSFPFQLRVGIDPAASLSQECLTLYHDKLLKMLQDFSKKINYWICVTKNCSYLVGDGVAINYETLKVDFIGNENVYTAVEVYVEMVSLDRVRVDYYSTCRAEIMDYMFYFINWPPLYTDKLLDKVGSGCPWPISFQAPKFISKPRDCPNVY